MKSVATDFLRSIASEEGGYSIGEPWRFTEQSLVAVVPLIRMTHGKRNYSLLSEAKDTVKIQDTGRIDSILLSNMGSSPVLVRAGEVIEGATQERALAVSQVLLPGEKSDLDCCCVHSSKGIRAGQPMRAGSFSPSHVRQTLYKGSLGSSLSGRLGPRFDGVSSRERSSFDYSNSLQQDVWGSVKCAARSMDSAFAGFCASGDAPVGASPQPSPWQSASDDLHGRLQESQDRFRAVLEGVPNVENQIGVCLVNVSGVESVNAYNFADSWNAARKAVLGADADKLVDGALFDGMFEFHADRAKQMLLAILNLEFDENVAVDKERSATHLFSSDKFVGEVVTLDEQPIYLSILRRDS